MIRQPPRSPLFPYTTLSRSQRRPQASQRYPRDLRRDLHRESRMLRPTPAVPTIFLYGDLFADLLDRKSTRLNSSHSQISYAVFCLKKKKITRPESRAGNSTC